MNHKQALENVKEMLDLLRNSDDSQPPPASPQTPNSGIFFSRRGRTVFLQGDVARRFGSAPSEVHDSLPAKRRAVIGRRTVETLLQEAVVDTIALPAGQDLTDIMKALSAGLNARPVRWVVHFAVTGVVCKRSASFGRLRLEPATPRAIARMKRHGSFYFKAGKSSRKSKSPGRQYFEAHVEKALQGRSLCRLEVEAVDIESADRLGRDYARLALDTLAFCDSLITPPSIVGRPSIDAPEVAVPPLGVSNEGTMALLGSDHRQSTDLKALLQHSKNGRLNQRISALLRNQSLDATSTRLVTAMSWAGRASGLVRREDQLLAYLIALESLLVGRKEGEVTLRIRMRCARVLGRNAAGRRAIGQTVKTLYDYRSSIVHAGYRDVTASDVQDAREIAVKTIVRLLLMQRPKAVPLDDWLEAMSFN